MNGSISAAWQALVEDYERLGTLSLDHVSGVVRRRKLTSLLVEELLEKLKEHHLIDFEPNEAIVKSMALGAMPFEEFISKHGYTVVTALEVYIKHMRETAETQGMAAMAAPFTEAADSAQAALDMWNEYGDW